jgi:beta-aspartyl-peptidase (threonine type)
LKPAVLVHGGAGPSRADDDARACEEGCRRAARAAYAVLGRGGSALEAVVAAVVWLEDDPLFNAGTGAVLDAQGNAVLDAAVMEGFSRRAGAVANVTDLKNPVVLARAVMEKTRHVLIAGRGASELAAELGIPRCAPGALVTARQKERWQARERERGGGTVGAVAIDSAGHVAAATSTGGTAGKRVGRIGDSPQMGSGTYADDRSGAVSMTGDGEVIIRAVAAKFACDALAGGESAARAAQRTVGELAGLGGEGGIILVDRAGALGFAFNTARMSRAWVDRDGNEGAGFDP